MLAPVGLRPALPEFAVSLLAAAAFASIGLVLVNVSADAAVQVAGVPPQWVAVFRGAGWYAVFGLTVLAVAASAARLLKALLLRRRVV